MGHCKGGPHMSYSPNKMGHESPAEMGQSPMENQNKGYAKQERKDLMQDMPIVKDAMGGRSWMSKHSNSALNFNKPKHNHTHPKGDKRGNTGHTGNAPTSSNTSRKDLAKMGSKAAPQMGHSPAEMSPLNDTETPAERKARLRKENAKKLAKGEANLARLKAEAEAEKNKPKKEKKKLSGLGKVARAIKNQFGDNDSRN